MWSGAASASQARVTHRLKIKTDMSIIYVLIPASLLLGLGALWMFIVALRSGQFDDLDTPAHRILFDDEETKPQEKGSL